MSRFLAKLGLNSGSYPAMDLKSFQFAFEIPFDFLIDWYPINP